MSNPEPYCFLCKAYDDVIYVGQFDVMIFKSIYLSIHILVFFFVTVCHPFKRLFDCSGFEFILKRKVLWNKRVSRTEWMCVEPIETLSPLLV